MKKIFSLISLLVFILIIILFQSCKEDSTTQPVNHAPKIENLSANPSTVDANGQTSLTCVATDEDGDNLIITWTAQNGTFPNGSTGTPVIWQAPATNGSYAITAIVSDGKLTDVDVVNVSVETSETAPQPPVLLSPSNNSENLSLPVLLVWDANQNTNSYTLQVSKDSLFAQIIYNQNLLTNTSQQITVLSNSTKYYWRVNSTNNYGTSGWSIVWSFSTMSTPCPGTPTVSYGGKTYNTVLINGQCWLKENLDIGTMINNNARADSMRNNGILEKYCYDNDPNNCDTYGGLYQWDEAMQYVTTEGTQGICPPGWHIPRLSEFETLAATVNWDGNALKREDQGSGAGQGTNTSGFSALLAGYSHYDGGFLDLSGSAAFWSSAGVGYNFALADYLGLYYYGANINLDDHYKADGFSVRCLKD